jgi:hypothetical protein
MSFSFMEMMLATTRSVKDSDCGLAVGRPDEAVASCSSLVASNCGQLQELTTSHNSYGRRRTPGTKRRHSKIESRQSKMEWNGWLP